MYSVWAYNYDDKWIIKNYPGKCTQAFVDKYNKQFGTNIPKETLRKHARTLNLKVKNEFNAWTSEMNDWLKSNYSKLGDKKACAEFIKIFGDNYTPGTIGEYARKKLGLKVDRLVAYNNRHSLHKGPKTFYEEGEVRTDKSNYAMIKIGNTWVPYRRYLWEQKYGKVPEGYSVTYLSEPDDYSLENTICIPKDFILLLTSHNLRAENPIITKCGIQWCNLYCRIYKPEVFNEQK